MNKLLVGLALVAAMVGCGNSGEEQAAAAQAAAAEQAAAAQAAAAEAQAQAQAAQPAAPTEAAPAAGGTTGCAKYRSCCDALASMPGMEAMRSSCAQIDQLAGLPNGAGDQSCNAALQGIQAMPNAPDVCKP